jgi:GntR family transcriptional repressor for pyruvate dehydrogenase complex
MLNPINKIIDENTEKIFELIEVREEIESWSAYHAANRATKNDIERLGGIVEEMKENLDSQKLSYQLDADFHLAISHASHNTIQSHLMFTIYDLLSQYLRFFIGKTFSHQEIRKKRYDQHLRIFKAIKKRNAAEARKRMLEHFAFLDRVLKKLMKDENLTSFRNQP